MKDPRARKHNSPKLGGLHAHKAPMVAPKKPDPNPGREQPPVKATYADLEAAASK